MPDKKLINLLRGWPSNDLLPIEDLREASQNALSDPSIYHSGLLYGPDMGYEPLRESLSEWLGKFYGPSLRNDMGLRSSGDKEDPSRITITGGASQAIACALQSFTDPSYTAVVWMVCPCYFLACNIFADAGLNMRSVPEDEEGVDLKYLAREMEALDKVLFDGDGHRQSIEYKHSLGPFRKIYRHIIYCVPNYSNPSGRTMTLPNRKGLIELARKHDALIIADDVYDMLQWESNVKASPYDDIGKPRKEEVIELFKHAMLPRLLDIDLSSGPSAHDPVVENLPPAMASSSAPPPPPSSSSTKQSGKQVQHFGHVLSNGSFSKLLGPGLRVGWTDSTPALARGISQTGSTRSGGAAGHFSSTIVSQLFSPSPSSPNESKIDNHIRNTLLPAYSRRYHLLREAVVKHLVLPYGVRIDGGDPVKKRDLLFPNPDQQDCIDEFPEEQIYAAGGYFLWLCFPGLKKLPPVKLIADRCLREENLVVGNGELFEVDPLEEGWDMPSLGGYMRLCFAYEAEEDLVEGVERLGRVVGRMMTIMGNDENGKRSWEEELKEEGVEGEGLNVDMMK